MMKRIFGLAIAALALSASLAVAQPPPVVFSGNYTQPTYSASVTGVVPAASATDWFTITGSATKLVTVTEITCTGVSTANATQLVQLAKRSTANSGGTSSAATAVPHNAGNSAATATVLAYTANPTAGTLIGYLRRQLVLTGPAASSTAQIGGVNWKFGMDSPGQGIVLSGITSVLAVNGNGASYSAGTAFTCSVTWTEIGS